jgi:hypothetical protein
MPAIGKHARTTVFAPRLQALLREHRGSDVFRLDATTVGVAGPQIMDRVLGARYATELERPTFKPLHGRSIPRTDAAKLMQAVGRDVRLALKEPVPTTADFTGEWPGVGHVYLRDMLLGRDPLRLRFLMDPGASAIASLTAQASTYDDRRYAMGLYRRTVAPVCFTISTLVANAMWLGAPFDEGESNRNIIHESMRLLPPSWNILRHASPEYAALDARIGEKDDVLVLPLLSHRDPALWDDPDVFRSERWNDLDPDDQPGYLPFGHASERCWGRHMVMPLAERLLDLLRHNGLGVSPRQTSAKVPLAGLLGVDGVKIVHVASPGRRV